MVPDARETTEATDAGRSFIEQDSAPQQTLFDRTNTVCTNNHGTRVQRSNCTSTDLLIHPVKIHRSTLDLYIRTQTQTHACGAQMKSTHAAPDERAAFIVLLRGNPLGSCFGRKNRLCFTIFFKHRASNLDVWNYQRKAKVSRETRSFEHSFSKYVNSASFFSRIDRKFDFVQSGIILRYVDNLFRRSWASRKKYFSDFFQFRRKLHMYEMIIFFPSICD